MRFLYALALAMLFAAPASAQYQVTAPGVPVTENFNSFRGAGFSATPSAGQFNSTQASIYFSDGLQFAFGGTSTAPEFARGASDGGVTEGGTYAFQVAPGDYALGFQPSTTGPVMAGEGGIVYFRFVNATGQTLYAADVSLDYYVRNDQDRASGIDLFYYTSADGAQSRQIDVIRVDGALTFTTPAASAAGAGWARTPISARYDGLAWAPGEFLIIGLVVADASGTGIGRDEIAFDNLSLVGQQAPSPVSASATLGSRPGAGNDAGWYLLSAPVHGLTVGSLAGQNLVQGLPTSYPDRPINVLTRYQANAPAGAGSVNDALEPGRGFWWYLFDDAAVAPESRDLPFSLAPSGPSRTGNVVVYNSNAGSTSNGLFPAGNPFDVPLALSGVVVNRTASIFDAVNVWDPRKQSYEVRSRIFGDVVEPWGGFVLETAVDGTILNASYYTYPATARRPGGTPAPEVPAGLRRLRFSLEGLTASGRPVADGALALVFAEGAVDGLDLFDGRKVEPLSASGLTAPAQALVAFRAAGGRADGRRAQDSRPFIPSATFQVPVAFQASEAGTFTLSWPLRQNVPTAWQITLTDLVTGAVTDLAVAPGYTFTAQATGWADRFTLTVAPGGATSAEDGGATLFTLSDAVPNPAREASRFTLRLAQSQHVRAALYDALGRQVAEVMDGPVAAGDAVQVEAALAGLAPGVYVLRVEGDTFQAARRLTVVR